jgi:polar amino acid transport system substrate-binding protein
MRLTTTFMNKYTDHLTVENEADLFILGYEQRLEQVIVNLLLNAAQSLPSKDKKVKLKAYLDKNEVKLEISDEGCGISEDNQKKIFEPFFTTKTDSGGTGLGLSISFGIIQDMGGQIKVESKIDQGTTFTVILPVHQSK